MPSFPQALYWRHTRHGPSTAPVVDKRRLNAGQFGKIFACRLVALPSQPAVVKHVWDDESDDFRRECGTLSLFLHPRIVRYFGSYAADDAFQSRGLVMQRVDGNLDEYLCARRNYPSDARRAILLTAATQIAEGLQVRCLGVAGHPCGG